jgi:hypothetical protein
VNEVKISIKNIDGRLFPDSLIKKLGIQPGMKVLLLNAPHQYPEWLEADISQQVVKSGEEADLVHLFVKNRKELEKLFPALIKKIKPEAITWISWYKKSSGIVTDVTEDGIRAVVLPAGWVDVKVCAVSDEWSALKIVKRKRPR